MPVSRGTYRFGPFVLDRSRRLLLRDGATVALTPKTFDLLTVLVESEGKVVSKEALMNALWPDTVVEESNLTFQVSALRKALGGERVVATIPGRGYQFVGRIEPAEQTFSPPRQAESLSHVPQTEFQETIIESEERTTVTVAESDATATSRPLLFAAVAVIAALILGAGIPIILHLRRTPETGTGSLAVLPFKPIVATQRDEVLELGMADTLITRLSHLPGMTVRPTSAVRRYAALDLDPVEAGRALGVTSVLEGTIQRSGDRMRVNVRLRRTSDGRTMWSSQFDQAATDLFEVQDRVADGVARSLTPTLSGRAEQRLAKRTTSDLEAYELYVKGEFWEAQPARALEFYERAVARDPRFAAAYAAIAESWLLRARFGNTTAREQFEKARAAATKAIELDPELGEAHAALAAVYGDWDWAWDRAEQEYKRALELSPNWGPAHVGYAHLMLVRRRFDKAVQHTQRAVELDPTSMMAGVAHGAALRCAGRIEESITHLKELLKMYPGLPGARVHLGLSYLAAGRAAEAVAVYEEALKDGGDSVQFRALYGEALVGAGRREEARAILRELEAAAERDGSTASFSLGLVCFLLGDADRGFYWLERAYQDRLYLLRVIVWDASYAPMRSDPRYQDLVRRMGL